MPRGYKTVGLQSSRRPGIEPGSPRELRIIIQNSWKRSLEPKRSWILSNRQLWWSITLQQFELDVWVMVNHLIIQSMSIWSQKLKGVAWLLSVLLWCQSNPKTLYKSAIVREWGRLTVQQIDLFTRNIYIQVKYNFIKSSLSIDCDALTRALFDWVAFWLNEVCSSIFKLAKHFGWVLNTYKTPIVFYQLFFWRGKCQLKRWNV